MTQNPTPIPRGADLTEDDLRQIVADFYEVRNWAALKMHMRTPEAIKEQCYQALRARLGRRPLVIGDGNA
jgi:hypothetical protein